MKNENQVEIASLSTEELEEMLSARKEQERLERQQKREAYENLKEETVFSLSTAAMKLHAQMKSFKEQVFSDMSSLYDLLQDYSDRHRDGKGNFSIESADQKFRISFKNQNLGHFDERANQAEKHIIDFVNKRFADDPGTKKLITTLLERKKGKLDIKLVQKLYSMEDDYDDESWKVGIKLLKESWQSAGSKSYVNFETKDQEGKWVGVVLNMSAI